jgi:hypothetical protein
MMHMQNTTYTDDDIAQIMANLDTLDHYLEYNMPTVKASHMTQLEGLHIASIKKNITLIRSDHENSGLPNESLDTLEDTKFDAMKHMHAPENAVPSHHMVTILLHNLPDNILRTALTEGEYTAYKTGGAEGLLQSELTPDQTTALAGTLTFNNSPPQILH